MVTLHPLKTIDLHAVAAAVIVEAIVVEAVVGVVVIAIEGVDDIHTLM